MIKDPSKSTFTIVDEIIEVTSQKKLSQIPDGEYYLVSTTMTIVVVNDTVIRNPDCFPWTLKRIESD